MERSMDHRRLVLALYLYCGMLCTEPCWSPSHNPFVVVVVLVLVVVLAMADAVLCSGRIAIMKLVSLCSAKIIQKTDLGECRTALVYCLLRMTSVISG